MGRVKKQEPTRKFPNEFEFEHARILGERLDVIPMLIYMYTIPQLKKITAFREETENELEDGLKSYLDLEQQGEENEWLAHLPRQVIENMRYSDENEAIIDRIDLASAFSNLPALERGVIDCLFFKEQTYRQCGERYGITFGAVRKIEAKAIE